jgi:hypothetical protein
MKWWAPPLDLLRALGVRPDPKAPPGLVALGSSTRKCSGVLLEGDMVISAGHCHDDRGLWGCELRWGSCSRMRLRNSHPHYDIALFQVLSPQRFRAVPVSLSTHPLVADEVLTLYGLGVRLGGRSRPSEGIAVRVLREKRGQVIVTPVASQAPCKGDSGAPLFFQEPSTHEPRA